MDLSVEGTRMRAFPPRCPRELLIGSTSTKILPGDRLLIDLDHGRVAFLRGIISMHVSNGVRHDSVMRLTYQPNKVLAEEIAQFCARLMTLDLVTLESRKPSQLLYEFAGKGWPIEVGIGDFVTINVARGTLALIRGHKSVLEHAFTTIQNTIAAVELAELCATILGLGLIRHSHSEEHLTLEFT